MQQQPTLREALKVFAKIGFLSFGGPAGQVALMHRELVEDRGWIEEDQFLRALNFCHLLPGPEAQQLATYIGWRMYGPRGGLAAGILFVIPGVLVILALSILYVHAARLGWFAALFMGVKAAVLALVVQALLRIGKRALKTPFQRGLSLLSFVALFFFNMPFPVVVIAAAAIGAVVSGSAPDLLKLNVSADAGAPKRTSLFLPMLRTSICWAFIWALPMGLVWLTLGPDHILFEIGVFFSKLAVVTFGGAYAVLAYMAQEAVQSYHWLNAGEMADGLGLAETTPGPLIMVTQFVGFLGAYRVPAPFTPLLAGILGAVLTTWVTFAPCFLWIFAFAPWIERLEHARRLQGGLAALTAAVVGVIGNLAVWFALHVLFASVGEQRYGPLRLNEPDWRSLDVVALALTAVAFLVLFCTRLGVLGTLCVCGVLAVAGRWFSLI